MEGSSFLAQQQLLEPVPRRRLIVPAGAIGHWGIDPGTRRVAAACVIGPPEAVRVAATASFPDLKGGARLDAIWRETGLFVAGLLRSGWRMPGVVWVEQPSGKQEVPELSYAVGVTMAAVYHAVMVEYGYPVCVETVPSSRWKLLACGRGNLPKTDPHTKKPWRNREAYGVLAWARANGYTGSSWDEADALGVAEAARREIVLDER